MIRSLVSVNVDSILMVEFVINVKSVSGIFLIVSDVNVMDMRTRVT